MRTALAHLLTPIMKATGFRFSKDYRHGTTTYHATVYALCDTVSANHFADMS